MNIRILFLPILILSLFLASTESKANVAVEDAEANNFFSSNTLIDNDTINTGSGSAGDYELISCVTEDPNTNNVNSFSALSSPQKQVHLLGYKLTIIFTVFIPG
jgi:hypothetical protein